MAILEFSQTLMTPTEVVAILRLKIGRKRPDEALRHLRRLGRLGFVRVGRRVLYRPEDVEQFIESCSVVARGVAGRVRRN